MEVGATLDHDEKKKSLSVWVDQMEEGLGGICTEWQIQLEKELISTREALRT